jgi:hypothetical protein
MLKDMSHVFAKIPIWLSLFVFCFSDIRCSIGGVLPISCPVCRKCDGFDSVSPPPAGMMAELSKFVAPLAI